MVDSYLGNGNSENPTLLFLSFDPTGDWIWEYIAEISNENEQLQTQFRPLIDFALSIRSKGFLSRKEEYLEQPCWNNSITVRIELELKIMQIFHEALTEIIPSQFYFSEYRNNELSLSFFPIAPKWKQPFSNLLRSLLSLPETDKDYYNAAYSNRANLFSQYFAKIYNNDEKPVTFILLPTEQPKQKFMINWMKELGLVSDSPDLSEIAIPNDNGTVWIIPDSDSPDLDYEKLQSTIKYFLLARNPSLFSKLKKIYGNLINY